MPKKKASAISSLKLILKKHHQGTPRGVRAEIRGTTSSKRRKAVSGLTEKGARNRQERVVAGRALIRRASDHRGGRRRSGRSEPTGPTPRDWVPQEGTQHRVSDHIQEWVPHVAFSRHHRRRRERPPHRQRGSTFGPAMWRARRLQKTTRNGLCREKGATDKNEPASDTLAVERSQGLGENNTQPETRERPLQRRFDLACLRFSVRVGCRRSSGRRQLAFGLGCRRLCLVCVPVLCARCQQPRCHPA